MTNAGGAARAAGVGLALLGLVGTSGCGLLIGFSSSPDRVGAGQTVTFDLTLTNPSKCPVGDVFAQVLPFLTPAQLTVEGPQAQQLFEAACSGTPIFAPDGTVCRVEGNQLICEVPIADTAPGTSNSLHVESGMGTLDCRQDGGTLTCTLPDLSAFHAPNAVFPPPPVLPCFPVGSPVNGFVCQLSTLAPGASASATLTAAAPAIPGTLSNLVFAGANDRKICKTGTNAGNPCSGDSDCSGVAGSCAPGICIDSVTQALGAGCDTATVNTDCAMGSTCALCDPGGPVILLPFACSQTRVAELAPSMSTTGIAASILGLVGVGFLGLMRRRQQG